MKLIAQGAEAKIYESGSKIVKDRIKKGYRLPEIDKKLRRTRTRAEARLIRMASRAGVPVPKILEVDDKQMKLEIENIEGSKVRDVLTPEMCKLIGKELLKLHKANIVHGDLTTSNMIQHKETSKIHLLDFGLSQFSDRIEDKAVDLFLMERSLESTHFEIPDLFTKVIEGYKDSCPSASVVLERLEAVRKRGRNKTQD